MEADVVIPAVAGVVGAVAGSGLSWIGESIRTKASRLFDRRVRQLDEVADLADAVGAMSAFPTSDDLRWMPDTDLISWENGHMAALVKETNRLIEKADRYRCDDEVEDVLIDLYTWCNDGSIEVAEGHSLMRQQKDDPDIDLKDILPFYLWLANLQLKARDCVNVAKKCLGEDESSRWHRWGALALIVLLFVAVVLVVVL